MGFALSGIIYKAMQEPQEVELTKCSPAFFVCLPISTNNSLSREQNILYTSWYGKKLFIGSNS